MKIDKNSRGTIALVYCIAAVLIAVLLIFVKKPLVVFPLIVFILWFCVWQLFFFRIPKRIPVEGNNKVLSVADGRIVIVEKAYEKEFLKRECIQVSIYMNFFDVHANFWPVSGTVNYYKYHPGLHALAFKPKASEENEHTCTCIKTGSGQDVFFKQIAGGFARRIVNYAADGLKVSAGSQCGIIKFGSRIDYFLPLDAEIKVSVGDLSRACESVIAILK